MWPGMLQVLKTVAILAYCAVQQFYHKCRDALHRHILVFAFRNTYGFKRLHNNASFHASTLWTLEEPTCPNRLTSSQTETTLGGSSITKRACQPRAYRKSLLSWGHAQQAALMFLPWLMKASLSEAMGPSFLAVLHWSRYIGALAAQRHPSLIQQICTHVTDVHDQEMLTQVSGN